jgi:pimeloyl-ACP methyl ester carboxylesterase
MEVLHRTGYTPAPLPVFFEEFIPAGARSPAGAGFPAVVLVHGGGFSGACYLLTPDGRPGWAYDFVRHGYRVVIPDWPGVGRSAGVSPDDVSGQKVADALGGLLDHLGQPAVLLVHSMSGPYGFRLLETHGHRIQALVAVAPGPPGNIQPVSDVVREDDTEVEIATPSVNIVVPRTGAWRPTREFAVRKLIGASTRLDAGHVDGLLAQTAPIPVKLLMGRNNLRGTPQLAVEQGEHFAGKPVLVLTGDNDADHPRETDLAAAEWLRGLGALADFYFLGDFAIHGNGHMLMSEDNSSQIAALIAGWLADLPEHQRT